MSHYIITSLRASPDIQDIVKAFQVSYIYTSDNMQRGTIGKGKNCGHQRSVGKSQGSDLVYRALCKKSSSVVPRRIFDGGTGVAHVLRGLFTLLKRRTDAGKSRLKEHEAWKCETAARHKLQQIYCLS